MVKTNHFSLVVASVFVSILLLSLVSASWSDWYNTITGKATSQPLNISVSVSNTAPQITRFVQYLYPDQSVTEASVKMIPINFSVLDADGFSNLNDASAKVNITRNGEAIRANSTCLRYQSGGTGANYSCSVDIWFFDGAGLWNITAFIQDSSGSVAINSSNNMTILETSAFITGPSALTFASIGPGSTNTTSNSDPLLLNNTGNKPITAGNIQINATDLVGQTTSTQAIYANNFSVGTATGSNAECGSTAQGATPMNHVLFTAISGSTLGKGNYTLNDGSTGQEQLYVCIRTAGSELSQQTYSTLAEGSWTTKII